MTSSEQTPTFAPLDVDNYATWSIRMRALLVQRGLWAAVVPTQGVLTQPGDDAKAHAAILLNVKDHHLEALVGCNSAKTAWDLLAGTYQAKNNARKMQLRKELSSLNMLTGEPMTKYVARAKSISAALATCGMPVPSTELVWSVLAGLPECYQMMATVLEMSDAELDIDNVLPKLLAVEQRQAPAREDVGVAFSAGGASHRGQRGCWECGALDHKKKDCPNKNKKRVGVNLAL